MTLLHSYAWQSMGLVANPVTGKTDKDLEQAQVAIDAVSYLAGQLETKLKGEELRQLHAMVSDLQLNFVQQQKSAEN
ncbi:MAG: DUF1844 domain-containing protein [Armatimonadetes bacterium]|nr:DUF1844 domain-containing protein [Armatimonadota bacterium]NIM23985.1 DUF1844 domain-containing protein [Armatimonadota bacterium]NIM67835.1 DUF1844 domain-containing protein [Armatimonadota bacterium]NIM76366.1 DUF1844 domain-containing protein [Armatimonadota bacterium]NIN06065.1 DUF1844 domain-containing protein [Armatimonadota bacterium]